MVTERDSIVDGLRGITILYIIFVIHGLCWLGFLPTSSILFSLLLFEMPVIFYISGAAQKLSSQKTFIQYLKSRVLRVILPYVVWCLITICFLFIFGNLKADWLNLLYCRSVNSIPFVWHTWFICPYLVIAIMGFWLFKFYQLWNLWFVVVYSIFIALIIALMDYLGKFSHSDILRPVLVYSVFYVYGYTYKDSINFKWKMLSLMMLLVFFASLVIPRFYPYYTQINKFPPNFAFLIYGGIAVVTLSLLLDIKWRKHNIHSSYIHTYIQHASNFAVCQQVWI